MPCSPACLLVSLLAVAVPAQDPQRSGETPPPVPPSQQQQQQEPAKGKDTAPAVDGKAQQPVPPQQRPRPAEAKALLAGFARMPGLEATYTEEKRLALLAMPLQSKGRILFLPPGYLLRQVEAPEPATLRITPDELLVEDRDRKEAIDLRRSDALRVFVTSLVQVFAGDETALQKAFTVTYTPDPKVERLWTLELLPKGEQLQRMMRSLTLRGEGEAVTVIEVVDPNGDRTTTRIVTADVARRFTGDEQKRWFGIEPR